jgi:hypothetical protein
LRTLVLLFEVMQDSRVLLSDFFDALHDSLGREVRGHAIEHGATLRHSPAVQRRSEAPKRDDARDAGSSTDNYLIHLDSSSLASPGDLA